MSERKLITGPTFEEMLYPHLIDPEIRARAYEARTMDPLASINLFNISWRDINNKIQYAVLPPELTGVETPIAVLTSIHFPTRSHKVGATYSVLLEKELSGEVDPWKHTLLWPSTGNYGSAARMWPGAWAARASSSCPKA